jgi:quercetin dioxygenase-like cupin family protein
MPYNYAEFVQSRSEFETEVPATRMEIARGQMMQEHHEQTECIVFVLEGALRFHFLQRFFTVRRNETLRIPAHVEYRVDALENAIAFKVSTQPTDQSGQVAFDQDDPDQYLWGV